MSDQPSISSLNEVVDLRTALEADGRRLVLTNGCFDLLHTGHVRYLRQARALGDALVVALNGDASVRRLKGPGRPLNPAEDRAEVLMGLESVDRVVVFEGDRATGVFEAVRPHVYCKGGDYTVENLNAEEREALDQAGSEIIIVPLVPGQSTSQALRKLEGDGERKLRLGVLGSGSGSNLEAIYQAIEAGTLDAEVPLVISDVDGARILDRARGRGSETVFVDPGPYRTKLGAPAQKEICDRLKAARVDVVVLAGFMRIVKAPVLDEFDGRIVNIHPSLLPKFPGLESWKQALEAGESIAGVTVHFVDAGMDTGPIIAQEEVPIEPGDTPKSLHARIQKVEHVLYPRVIGELGAKLRDCI